MRIVPTIGDMASLSLSDKKLQADVRCVNCGANLEYYPNSVDPEEGFFRCGQLEEVDDGHRRYLHSRPATYAEAYKEALRQVEGRRKAVDREIARGW